MIDNLDEIYDDQGPSGGTVTADPGPKPKPKSTSSKADAYLGWANSINSSTPSAGQSFQFNADTDDVKRYFGDTGVQDPTLAGRDNQLLMGSRQGTTMQIARKIGTMIPDIIASIPGVIGAVGTLFQSGDDRNYSNMFTEAADSIKNWGERNIGQVYRQSNSTWALSDPAFWVDNIGGALEFAATMAATGGVAGTAAKALGSGVAASIDALGGSMTAEGAKFLQTATQYGAGGLSSYLAMGAPAGAKVFKDTYDNQLTKLLGDGLAPDEAEAQAKHIAAQSAATAAQLTTALTMAMSAKQLSPLFRDQASTAQDILSGQAGLQGEETMSQAGTRIGGMNAADYTAQLNPAKSIGNKLASVGRMGLENTLLQFSEKTGEDLGKEGKTRGFFDQFGELSHLIDRSANSEGLLSFAVGAAAGYGMHTLMHSVIPAQYIERVGADGKLIPKVDGDGSQQTDSKGNPIFEKQLVTGATADKWHSTRAFNNLRDALSSDYQGYADIQARYLDAMKKGNTLEAENIKSELYRVGQLQAIRTGNQDIWVDNFQKIAAYTPEEAQAAGYSSGADDLAYKDKAQEAVGDIQHLSNVYDKLRSKFGDNDNEGVQQLKNMVFSRAADLYYWKKNIDAYENNLNADDKNQEELGHITPGDTYNQAINEYVKNHSSATEVVRQLKSDMDSLSKAAGSKDSKTIDRLIRKYRAVGSDDKDTSGAVKDLLQKITAKHDQMQQRAKDAEDQLFNSSGYLTWLEAHPGKSFDDYRSEVQKRTDVNSQNLFRRANLEKSKAEYDIASQNMQDVMSESKLKRFAKKYQDWNDQLTAETDKSNSSKLERLAEATKDKDTLDRLQRISQNQIAGKYKEARDQVATRLQDIDQQLIPAAEAAKNTKNPIAKWKAVSKVKELNRQREIHAKQYTRLDSLFQSTQVADTDLVSPPKTPEEVMGANKDLEENPVPTDSTATTVPNEVTISQEPVVETPEDEITKSMREIEEASPVADMEAPSFVKTIMDTTISPLIDRIGEIDTGLTDGTLGFSYDLLNDQIAANNISQEGAVKLLQSIKEYHDKVDQVMQDATNSGIEPSAEEKVPGITVDVPSLGIPHSPIINNSNESIAFPDLSSDTIHAGKKIVSALSGAASTINYREFFDADKNAYVKVIDPTSLDPKANQDLLQPKKLLPGHKIQYVVDTDYDGTTNIDDELSNDEFGNRGQKKEDINKYFRSGRVIPTDEMISNVPIKVVDAETGKTLTYVHRMDWLMAKYPGTSDYRNIVDKIVTPDGEVIDNLSAQRDALMGLRKAIVEQHNANNKPLDGNLGAKGNGTLILNRETNVNTEKSKIVPKLARSKDPSKSMLPDEKLSLVISNKGTLYSAKNHQFPRPVSLTSPARIVSSTLPDLVDGAVGAMVQSANGEYMFASLLGQKLHDPSTNRSSAVKTVTRAIELHLLNDGTRPDVTRELNDLQRNTGFDVSMPQGLRAFINQYFTYSQDFQDSQTAANAISPDSESRKEQFLFNVDDKAVLGQTRIKAGFSYSGVPVLDATIKDGRLNPEFIQTLEQGFQQRSRAVVYTDPSQSLRGINSSGTFRDVIYTSDGKWRYTEYPSYNEYVKSWSKTAVYGRNKLSDGTYTYTANPVIPLEVNKDPHLPATVIEENTTPATPNHPVTAKYDTFAADLFDSFSNKLPDFKARIVKEIGTAPEGAKDLTIDNLRELYNFTPEEQRNGRTPQEILDELTARGHSFLADGFNPFSRCL